MIPFRNFIKNIKAKITKEDSAEMDPENDDSVQEDDQEKRRDAWYKGDEYVAQHKKDNPLLYDKKASVTLNKKKKGDLKSQQNTEK
jgi:hypothetical protein